MDQNHSQFAAIMIHGKDDGLDIPWGLDRFNNFYSQWPDTPLLMFNGWWGDLTYPEYEQGLLQAMGEPTDVTIVLTAREVSGPQWQIWAEVCVEAGGTSRQMRIYIADTLEFFPPPSTYSRNGIRQVAPTTDITVAPGSCSEVTATLTFDTTSWNYQHDIKIVAWAQEPSDSGPAEVFQAAQMRWPFRLRPGSTEPEFARDFQLPVPLFASTGSAWLEDAASAAVINQSEQQISTTYKVLCGDTTGLHPTDDPPTTDWPFADVTYEDYTIPIFRAGDGQQQVFLCDYSGSLSYPNPKWGVPEEGGPISVPSCADTVRPAGPADLGSDGHLILYDPATATAYDFWQASTVINGQCNSSGGGLPGEAIPEAGYADFFDVNGLGSNPQGVASARATGVPLLAGMILPEDVSSGAIAHALAVAIPGPRNLSPDPFEPTISDYFFPAATTETDMYSTNPSALAAGQRLRMKPTLVDSDGEVINEADLAPITVMFITALRNYGAYVIDNASGFTFYAEDIHTAALELDDDQLNQLIGVPVGTPLASDKTRWQLAMEALNLDLEGIPFAAGECDGASSAVSTANFEVVDPMAMDLLPPPRNPGGRL